MFNMSNIVIQKIICVKMSSFIFSLERNREKYLISKSLRD